MRRIAQQFFCLICVLSWIGVPGRSQELQPGEYQLKAAFLYNFGKFVEWPRSAFVETNSPLVIGVLGQNPFAGYLEKLVHDKSIGPHPLVVQAPLSVEEGRKCHILFVCSSEAARFHQILESMQGAPVLTVGDDDNHRFITGGGMINLFKEGQKIRFEINERAVNGAGLKASSKLLSLAARFPR